MRILYVLNTLAVGGTERQVLAIASRMATRGHTVSLLVLRGREANWFPTELNVVSLDSAHHSGRRHQRMAASENVSGGISPRHHSQP